MTGQGQPRLCVVTRNLSGEFIVEIPLADNDGDEIGHTALRRNELFNQHINALYRHETPY